MASDPSLWSPEGCPTPILAASPQVDSPIVSPDSCLDEENLLDDQNLCIECATSHSFQSTHVEAEDTPSTVLTEDSQDTKVTWVEPTATVIETVEHASSEEVIQRISEKVNQSIKDPKIQSFNPEPEKVEIHSSLHVSTDKLNTLLGQLEVDKLYPNQDIDCQEEEDLLSSPRPLQSQDSVQDRPKLRKCSSLKTGRTPPVTPGGRKFVR